MAWVLTILFTNGTFAGAGRAKEAAILFRGDKDGQDQERGHWRDHTDRKAWRKS